MGFIEVYKALGDESRLRLVHILSKGFFNVGELTSLLALSQSTISHHLKILGAANLVESRREGTWSYYALRGRNEDTAPDLAVEIVRGFIGAVSTRPEHSLSEVLEEDNGRVQGILSARRDRARDFFEAVAHEWHDLRGEATLSPAFLDSVLPLLDDDSTVLELGCGSGAVLERLLPRSGETIGVDFAPAMLDASRRTLAEKVNQVDLRLGYLEHLPLADESVDIALGYMVFHHIPEPPQALADAWRVLRPGGRLLIVDLTRHDNEYMRERFADLWLGFEPKEFSNWASDVGFERSEVALLGRKSEAFILTATK